MYLGLKITFLFLKHFECLESGLKKSEITIDLSNSKHPINVFIGKIGSGKTFILSHLQPFATVGTLDIRNQDDQIVHEKDGQKVICYQSIESLYTIRHEYNWNEKSETHVIKSYFEKDGEELNPNGSVTTFKYIVLKEFGLEQNNLRLIRLGQNVSGFLEYTGTERKNYVASLLESADAILALNRGLREELRNYNTRISILSNKLNQFGAEKEEEYKTELEVIDSSIEKVNLEIREKEATIVEYNTEISLIAPNGYSALVAQLSQLLDVYETFRTERNNLQEMLLSLHDDNDVESLMKHIGALENERSTIVGILQQTEDEYTNQEKILNKTEESIRIIKNDAQLNMLRNSYEMQKSAVDEMQSKISTFQCKFSSSYLKNLITDLHSMDIMISDVAQYDQEIVSKCYLSDSSIVSWARKQGDIITGRKVNLQKKMNNLSFSATYKPIGVMYIPPFCPTEDCPFRKTHPYTLAKGKSKSVINDEIESIRNEIDKADRDLYRYAEIPTIYTKIASLKERYRELSPILKSLDALRESNLLQILTRIDHQVWYNYNRLIDMQELALSKEAYYDLVEELRKIEEELRGYESSNLVDLERKRDEYCDKMRESLNTIQEKSSRKKELDIEMEQAQVRYQQLLQRASNEKRLVEMNHNLDQMSKDVTLLSKNVEKISPYASIIESMRKDIAELSTNRDRFAQRRTRLIADLSNLESTKKEMNDVLLEQRYLSLMVNATSSKEGIPLYMVNQFVSGCKDIANDLTFDIFEEDIQLEDFEINDKEFYIPYSVNGKYVKDITKASQGQRSLFNIAIAFAFAQEMHLPYDIPLMDEVDAPLHKPEQSKFLSMVLRQMKSTGCVQSFLITHNSLENLPVNFIATTEEDINLQNGSTLIKLYE